MALRRWLFALFAAVFACQAYCLVRLEEGAQTINGVQLLQDYNDAKRFYYVPNTPRLAQNADGSFQLMCLKYVDVGGKASGGLFHALIDFTLPESTVKELESKLRRRVPDAVIVGMVPMTPATKDSGAPQASFEIVSAILKNQSFTQSVISSGQAPLTPGSRAAIAAVLTPPGATLLFDSLASATSDVSVGISGTYEAAIVGFSARITAEFESVYRHLSEFRNQQSGFTRETLRSSVDDMRKSGILKVEVLDRSATQTGFKTNEMNAIVDVLTQRIADTMFTAKVGLEPAPAGEDNTLVIPGREALGFLEAAVLGGSNQRYIPDRQFILKRRNEIREAKFDVVLTKSGTVRVPVFAAGNLRVQHETLKEDPRYFRTIDLADPAFDLREVFFQVDAEIASSFAERVNYVTVSMRKTHDDNPETVKQLTFTAAEVGAGNRPASLKYARLGDRNDTWLDYEYRVTWSFRGRDPISLPSTDGWKKSNQHIQNLRPPLDKFKITFEGEKGTWLESDIVAVSVQLEVSLLGKPSVQRMVMRAQETETAKDLVYFADPSSKYKLTKTWIFKDGRQVVEVDAPSDSLYVNLRRPGP